MTFGTRTSPGTPAWRMSYGATPVAGDRVQFRVWAPVVERLALKIEGRPARIVPMTREGEAVEALTRDVRPGNRYRLVVISERARRDPASRAQPRGLQGPSAVP